MQQTSNGEWKQVTNFNSFSPALDTINCHISNGVSDFLTNNNTSSDICITVDRGNVERKNILDVIREEKDQQFLVSRLCKTSTMAYFCGSSLDKNTKFINGTDSAINVSDIILSRESNGQWKKVVALGNFASSTNTITCLFGKENVALNNDVLHDAAEKLDDNQ